MSSSFTLLAAYDWMSFWKAESYSIVWLHCILLIHYLSIECSARVLTLIQLAVSECPLDAETRFASRIPTI